MGITIKCDENEAMAMLKAVEVVLNIHSIKERMRRCIKDDNIHLLSECIADLEFELEKVNPS